MKLIKYLGKIKPNFVIFTGDGRNEFNILEELCKKYNRQDIILWFPTKGIKKQTGLAALNVVKQYPSLSKINSMIYLVDGEYIEGDACDKINAYLE